MEPDVQKCLPHKKKAVSRRPSFTALHQLRNDYGAGWVTGFCSSVT